MKKILFLILIASPFISEAQVLSSYGHTPWTIRQYTSRNNIGTLIANGFDTLVAAGTTPDTGYVQFNFPNAYNMNINLFVTKITGTLAGNAIFQGSYLSTPPAVNSSTWQTITGNTTYCAGCIGASATLTGAGTTQYTWQGQEGGGNCYNYYQLRIITTNTNTATYTTQIGYKN